MKCDSDGVFGTSYLPSVGIFSLVVCISHPLSSPAHYVISVGHPHHLEVKRRLFIGQSSVPQVQNLQVFVVCYLSTNNIVTGWCRCIGSIGNFVFMKASAQSQSHNSLKEKDWILQLIVKYQMVPIMQYPFRMELEDQKCPKLFLHEVCTK